MGKGFAFGAVLLGLVVSGPQGANAAAVPYTLKGTWVCTFTNGETATIKARAGRQGVSYQRSSGNSFNVYIANTNEGGISAHGDGWAWTLTPAEGGAQLVIDAKAKGEIYKAACASK